MEHAIETRGDMLTREIPDTERGRRYRRFASLILLAAIVLLSHSVPSAGWYAIEVTMGARPIQGWDVAFYGLQVVGGGLMAWMGYVGRYRGRVPNTGVMFLLVALVWAVLGVQAMR